MILGSIAASAEVLKHAQTSNSRCMQALYGSDEHAEAPASSCPTREIYMIYM